MTVFAFCAAVLLVVMSAAGMVWPDVRRWARRAWERNRADHALWIQEQARRDLAAHADRAGRGTGR